MTYEEPPKDGIGYLILTILFFIVLGLLLLGCNTVKKSQSELKEQHQTVTVLDTVKVVKYDTSKFTKEVTEYRTKVIELYDTVKTVKDSIITRLVSRTIYTDSKTDKTDTRNYKASDSLYKAYRNTDFVDKDETKQDKETSRLPVFLILGVVMAVVIIVGVKILAKKVG
jgi:hypothetical protein